MRILTALVAAAWALPSLADQLATTSDGRTVRLFDDGRWEYVAEDVGRHVREPVSVPLAPVPPAPVLAGASRVTLDKVEILRREKRRTKTRNVATRTVFHLTVENTSAVTLTLDEYMVSRFKAISSTGTSFRIIGFDFEGNSIAPGGQRELMITAEDSPQWPLAKHVVLEIAPDTFANPDRYMLRTDMSEIRTREVDRF